MYDTQAPMQAGIEDYARPKEQRFNPYSDNGGTIVAIAGDGYAVIASETRLSQGYQIMTRNQPKLITLTDETILGATGCWCDVLTFGKVLQTRLKMYRYEHNRTMSTKATSQLVANQLYARRFFPYYVSTIIAGLEEDGQGWVYSYDPIGHREKTKSRAGGSSASLLQPMLDSQVALKNWENPPDDKKSLSKEAAVTLIKDLFSSASERDIYCGDAVLIKVVTKEGITDEIFQLRKD